MTCAPVHSIPAKSMHSVHQQERADTSARYEQYMSRVYTVLRLESNDAWTHTTPETVSVEILHISSKIIENSSVRFAIGTKFRPLLRTDFSESVSGDSLEL